jgi:hypothetical protein
MLRVVSEGERRAWRREGESSGNEEKDSGGPYSLVTGIRC